MTGTEPGPLPGHEVQTLDAYRRAANYLSAGRRAIPLTGALLASEAGNPVEGLAQAPRDLLVRPGRNVRNGYLDGHP